MKKLFVILIVLSVLSTKSRGAVVAGATFGYPVIDGKNVPVTIGNNGEESAKRENTGRMYSYIHKFKPLADSLSAQYGIPTSVILGVAIIESGLGRDRNPRLLNNYFGVVGKNDLMQTMGIKTMYKQYASAEASFVDFCKIISRKKYYSSLKGNPDYKAWVSSMSNSGYSTSPAQWKSLILDVIRRNVLNSI